MVQVFLYVAGLLLLGIVIFIAIKSRTAYQEAKYRQTKIDWASAQLERALVQTASSDETTVLAGIQCLSMLNIPEIRFKALHRLDKLTESENPLIAKHAEGGLIRLSKSSAQSECSTADSE